MRPSKRSVGPLDNQWRNNRRGSLLVEMVVCTVLLSVVAAILVPGIHAVHEQRKASRFDGMALIELNNQAAIATRNGISSPELSAWFKERYPAATLSNEELQTENGLTSVRLQITRPSVDSRPDVVRSLVVWIEGKEAAE